MFTRKEKKGTPLVSDYYDWYVKVPDQPKYNMNLATRDQCRAYKRFVETLGYEAHVMKREYSGKKSEGAFVQTERLVR